MGIITKALLKLNKSPKGIYSAVKKLAPKVIDFAITENQYDATEAIEKELLLSSYLLKFDPAKDMRSNFILDYIKEIENTFMSYNNTEDIINYFEGSGCGVCFSTRDNQTAKDSLHEYIISRLVLYRKIITELHCGNYNRFDCLYYAIYNWSFSVFRYSNDKDIDFLKDEMVYDNHNIGHVYIKYKELLPRLDKTFYNMVEVPKATWMTNHPDWEEFHTEGLLPYLKLNPGDRYRTFQMSGAGILKCCSCGYTQELITFLHGEFDAIIGRQCPQCGTFCTEENHSEQYHSFGPSKEDLVCTKCGYTIRKKEESIFKGNANPLFCPKCYSTKLDFHTTMIT